ncbi:family 43 glycosylhydrolase [Vallitalea pronyensis]|uniref:Family 43 glycosylhydrolase n=1 Tax=Vallitalea pronyensis TaxID=1348613 RepID=A0A8J8MNS9_9FIRM|nr:family 43 glycosylhydrolase [Vallitalea pronyensis]QUI25337.1 family 43 glycosylhydrolase [Vallitalea pronyensis]
MKEKKMVRTPLYRDPLSDGAADPTIIYNVQEQSWWMVYTQRRAARAVPGVSASHGSALGIASSTDGEIWNYRGTLNLNVEKGHNTYWAPEIIYDAKKATYHMYVTYVQGVPSWWGESERSGIVHMVSTNLWDWDYIGFIGGENSQLIDVCIHPLKDGGYRMWYRNSLKGCIICSRDSTDLYSWSDEKVVLDDVKAEGPNVFAFKGYYWMVTDPVGIRQGLAVYRSDDLEHFQRQKNILHDSSSRDLDNSVGRHPDILIHKDEAYIFYFTQPYKDYSKKLNRHTIVPIDENRCVIQVARLQVEDGQLICDRNGEFELHLKIS